MSESFYLYNKMNSFISAFKGSNNNNSNTNNSLIHNNSNKNTNTTTITTTAITTITTTTTVSTITDIEQHSIVNVNNIHKLSNDHPDINNSSNSNNHYQQRYQNQNSKYNQLQSLPINQQSNVVIGSGVANGKLNHLNSNISNNSSSNNSSNFSSSSSLSGAKMKAIINSGQENNSYQYLRHIREIDTATKLLSPLTVGDELHDKQQRSFRSNSVPTGNLTKIDNNVHNNVNVAEGQLQTHLILPRENDTLSIEQCHQQNITASSSMLSFKENLCNINNIIEDDKSDYYISKSLSTSLASTSKSSISSSTSLKNDQISSESDISIIKKSGSIKSLSSKQNVNNDVQNQIENYDDCEKSDKLINQQQSQQNNIKSNIILEKINIDPSISTSTSTLIDNSNNIELIKTNEQDNLINNQNDCDGIDECDRIELIQQNKNIITTETNLLSDSNKSKNNIIKSNNGVAIEKGYDFINNINISNKINDDHRIEDATNIRSITTTTNTTTTTTTIINNNNNNNLSNITLPIIMPHSNSSLTTIPMNTNSNLNSNTNSIKMVCSASTTPKHARYSKPRLSLSRFVNHSMPSVHGRLNTANTTVSIGGMTLVNNGGNIIGSLVPGLCGGVNKNNNNNNNMVALHSSMINNGNNIGHQIDNNNGNPPKRPSTHQRNLSLDFRSMGILLPPVSQVTNTHINITQHHRNRSLDSVLQRIPEVEVVSPNAESENTFCTPALLGTTMCSKIVTTVTNAALSATITQTPTLTSSNDNHQIETSKITVVSSSPVVATMTKDLKQTNAPVVIVTAAPSAKSLHSLPLNVNILNNIGEARKVGANNGITISNNIGSATKELNIYFNTICDGNNSNNLSSNARPNNMLTTNKNGDNNNIISQRNVLLPKSIPSTSVNLTGFTPSISSCVPPLRTPNGNGTSSSNIITPNNNINNNTNNGNKITHNNKKREDLTSLGSDDSGIICGSDSDQISLHRIRYSHESLDSGEMDAEEECIDMLETTSMDEEYNMLQSDLRFYQALDADCQTLRPSRKKHPNNLAVAAANQKISVTIDAINKIILPPRTTNPITIANIIELEATNGCDDNSFNHDNNLMNKSDDIQQNNLVLTIPESPINGNNGLKLSNDVFDSSTAVGIENVTLASTHVGHKAPKVSDTNCSIPTTESNKNDVLFKNFFGATKNAIFRTAQSIIDNHEKKNAFKLNKSIDDCANVNIFSNNGNQTSSLVNGNITNNSNNTSNADQSVKSPTDISKKKEFFGLLTSNASKKAAAAAAAVVNVTTTPSTTTTPNTSPLSNLPLFSDQLSSNNCSNGTNNISINNVICNNFNNASNTNLKCNNSDNSCEKVTNILTEKTLNLQLPAPTAKNDQFSHISMTKSSSISSLNKLRVPGVVKCFVKERSSSTQEANTQQKTEKGPSGLLRFFESPVFSIHFAIHYLFYSKEPGVLSFIGNKIFSFPDSEVDLYIPQLIIMYIQMDELAEVLDPYLTIRCRKSVDFSLKCLWLLEAYNYQPMDTMGNRKSQLALMKELYSKKERKQLAANKITPLSATMESTSSNIVGVVSTLTKKTHHRSQSDATVLLSDATPNLSIPNCLYQEPPYNTAHNFMNIPGKLCLGDLTSGRAFDNGCTCFESVRGQVNHLLGQKTVCSCNAPKTTPQKEFMKALINVGKNLTALSSKAEKTSALRMFLNLINKNLPARVWLPLYSDIPHHVVRITEEKTAVLNSKDKTPYIIYVEVVEVSDIYSSALIAKMMPSLRHTKSEEHLECGNGLCQNHQKSHRHNNQHQHRLHPTCSRTSSCSSHSSKPNVYNQSTKTKSKLLTTDCTLMKEQRTDQQNNGPISTSMGNEGPSSVTSFMSNFVQLNDDDVWSQEDDDITAQYMQMHKMRNNWERDAISQMSMDSCDSRDPGMPIVFNIGDVRSRHCNNLNCENMKSFNNDPEDPSAAALKEPWHEKEKQIRNSSPYGHLSNWRLLSAIVKCGDDLRQELMATQLLQMFKIIWQEENVDLWVRPYKIICLSNDSGLIEPILNTVSLHQIKKNSNKLLRDYFLDEYGPMDCEAFQLAQRNFVQSCAAYCIISYLLQVKDRHNGNILLHSDGHIIHIDFGFILSISPKNLGFEQSPFKLTPEFVDIMGGTDSKHWREFNRLLLIGMMTARKHMDRIINFVEIMRSNAQLPCFKNGCSGTVQNLRKRFHMNLTQQEMERKVEQLVQDSLKSLSTKLYDGYQYYTNGIL